MKKKIRIFIISLVVAVIIFVPVAHAVDISTYELPGGREVTLDSIYRIVINIADWTMAMAMIFAVIWFVWAGIRYMTGGDKPEAAKKMFWNGVIGTMIILGVGVIIRTIIFVVRGGFFDF